MMQKNQWQCQVKVKKRKKNGQPHAVVDNILDRNFQSDRPIALWTEAIVSFQYIGCIQWRSDYFYDWR